MQKSKLVEKDFIHLNSEAESFEDIIKLAGESFLAKNVVKDTYIDAVIEREKTFPTGLPTKGYNIAIPHTDSEHVNSSSVAVIVTKKPIEVSMMGSPDVKLDCQLFFPLAMGHPKKQLELLKQLMNFFQDEGKLAKIFHADSKDDVIAVMSEIGNFT